MKDSRYIFCKSTIEEGRKRGKEEYSKNNTTN
jgi:hypothetical protein